MKKTVLFSLLMIALSGTAMAGNSVNFLAPDASDLLPVAVTSTAGAKSLPNLSMDSVSYCWPLKADAQIQLHQEVYTALSREYRLRVTAEQLRSGIDLPTTAQGALIRLNPAGSAQLGKALSINPRSIILVDPAGKKLSGGQGMLSLADAEALKAADVPFAEGTSAFRLDPALGAGTFRLSVPSAPDSEAGWVINVLEKDSPVALSASTDRGAYLQGQRLHAVFALTGADRIESVRVEIHSPSGNAQPLRVVLKGGSNTFEVAPLLKTVELSEGLWEVHAKVRGISSLGPVIRDVHTAFALSAPTATFLGRAEVLISEGVIIDLPLDVGAQGRYAAQAVLFGTNEAGAMQPIGVCQAADYFAAGHASLRLDFDASLIQSSGLKAPYELRDLEMKDQGRMGELYRQGRALIIK